MKVNFSVYCVFYLSFLFLGITYMIVLLLNCSTAHYIGFNFVTRKASKQN